MAVLRYFARPTWAEGVQWDGTNFSEVEEFVTAASEVTATIDGDVVTIHRTNLWDLVLQVGDWVFGGHPLSEGGISSASENPFDSAHYVEVPSNLDAPFAYEITGS